MNHIPLQSGIIYGPVKSRRLGWSLGLNISPTSFKLCSFNCVYCQYGWTAVCTIDMADRLGDFPTVDDFGRALESALRDQKRINNITFSGNGEPTLHPKFEDLVDIAKQLKQAYSPWARLSILSNSSSVSNEMVRRALAKLDFRLMKLDAGDPETFKKINRPCRGLDYGTILDGLKSLENVTLQTMFVDRALSNVGEREVSEWIERIDEIKPVAAQIYSLHRPPAEPYLREVLTGRLREIAIQAEQATGVSVEVIIAEYPYRKKINSD